MRAVTVDMGGVLRLGPPALPWPEGDRGIAKYETAPGGQSFTGGRGGFCSASLVSVTSVGVASALFAPSPEP